MDSASWGPVWAVAGGIVTFIANYLRDRRKERATARTAEAAGDVAEKTVQHQVDVSSATAYEARLVLLQKTWDAERESLERQVTAAEQRAVDAETREGRKHAELLSVLAEMDQLRTDFAALQAQLHTATRRVTELLAQDDESNPHRPVED